MGLEDIPDTYDLMWMTVGRAYADGLSISRNSVSGAESDVVDWRNGIEEYFNEEKIYMQNNH